MLYREIAALQAFTIWQGGGSGLKGTAMFGYVIINKGGSQAKTFLFDVCSLLVVLPGAVNQLA